MEESRRLAGSKWLLPRVLRILTLFLPENLNFDLLQSDYNRI